MHGKHSKPKAPATFSKRFWVCKGTALERQTEKLVQVAIIICFLVASGSARSKDIEDKVKRDMAIASGYSRLCWAAQIFVRNNSADDIQPFRTTAANTNQDQFFAQGTSSDLQTHSCRRLSQPTPRSACEQSLGSALQKSH